MPCTPPSSFLTDLFEKFLIPILVATITFIAFRWSGEWKKRRSYSKLGVAIIDSLIEEVRTGIGIMNAAILPATQMSSPWPRRAWNGMKTIPDDVLLRIIEVSGKKTPLFFSKGYTDSLQKLF